MHEVNLLFNKYFKEINGVTTIINKAKIIAKLSSLFLLSNLIIFI